MKVEATLIQQTNPDVGKLGIVEEIKTWEQLFSPRYRDRTLIGILIMVFQRKDFLGLNLAYLHSTIYDLEWSGINALLYYGPTLVHSIGLPDDSVSLLVSGGIGIVQFIAVFPVILYIDKLGNFPTLSVSFTVK